MSWNFLDGPSRRQHHSCWTVPDHLGEGSQYGSPPFRRPMIPNPDLLLQYVDKAISAAEYAQATVQLSLLNGSSSSSLLPAASVLLSSSSQFPTVSSLYPVRCSGNVLSRTPLSIAPRKTSRFKSVSPLPQEYINSLLKHKRHQDDATKSLRSFDQMVAEGQTSLEGDSSSLSAMGQVLEAEGSSGQIGESDRYDARAADNAYRAAYRALSEGKPKLALSLLHVALAKCPPDKTSALEKVHKLMGVASQLIEKEARSTAKDS